RSRAMSSSPEPQGLPDPHERRTAGSSPFPSWERRKAEAQHLLAWATTGDVRRGPGDPDR
ncbi:MAG: hypothetical protein JWO90_2408, partial [Solirubrobacterales bacterium]|nr:hypothetical protein [Solirubrobacterales bacterium]